MKQIAVFGAAFNPPHCGHIDVIQQLSSFDEIWLVPAASHAFGKQMLPFDIRVQMLENLLADFLPHHAAISICLVEQDILIANHNRGPVYSYDVLSTLRDKAEKDGKKYHFSLIVGPDNAAADTWKRFYRYQDIDDQFGRYIVQERIHIRSTQIRELIFQCKGNDKHLIKQLKDSVGEKNADLIVQKGLFSS